MIFKRLGATGADTMRVRCERHVTGVYVWRCVCGDWWYVGYFMPRLAVLGGSGRRVSGRSYVGRGDGRKCSIRRTIGNSRRRSRKIRDIPSGGLADSWKHCRGIEVLRVSSDKSARWSYSLVQRRGRRNSPHRDISACPCGTIADAGVGWRHRRLRYWLR